MNVKDQLNSDLYNASGNLFAAAKLLKEHAPKFSMDLMLTADQLLSIIEAPEQKINTEDMDDILNDILNSKE